MADAAADDLAGAWNDFTNNFASDIAPLVTLFGEQVTKQFLSESTGILDNIIFGVAPLGILTAVVSVIRISGWPGLKALVGRAQEPHGVAEAELCSSTSRDVCELWSEGGICRVFGRPKILEFFHKSGKDDFYPTFSETTTEREVEEPGACNVYRPVCFLGGKRCCKNALSRKDHTCGDKNDQWTETKATQPEAWEKGETEPDFAPFPNLSLNIGIRKTPGWALALTAVFGALLQLSFFAFATYITFYRDDLYTGTPPPRTWSFVLTVLGTVMVVAGMILCAFLVERKSEERHFSDGGKDMAKYYYTKGDTTMYWLQPGNQRVGDQQFNAFSHSRVKHDYITSWKIDRGDEKLGPVLASVILVFALFFSVVGYILQFVGFRGLHGSVALYQIAATLLMSAVRALLRLRRLDPDDNNLRTTPGTKEGCELDWQAMTTFADRPGPWWEEKRVAAPAPLTTGPSGDGVRLPFRIKQVTRWRIRDGYYRSGIDWTLFQGTRSEAVAYIAVINADNSRRLYGFRPRGRKPPTGGGGLSWSLSLDCAREAVELARHNEGVYGAEFEGYFGPNPVAMVALLRSRFAFLTGDGIDSSRPQWDGFARSASQQLQLAVQGLANYVFSVTTDSLALQDGWEDVLALAWHTTAVLDWTCSPSTDEEEDLTETVWPLWLSFPMFRYGGEWKISRYRLEAVISLWASSALDRHSATDDSPNDKAVVVGAGEADAAYSTLKLWMPAANLKLGLPGSKLPSSTDAWAWESRTLVGRDHLYDADPSIPLSHRLITMRARSSRIQLIAQNLLTIFISQVAHILKIADTPDDDLFSAWVAPQTPSQMAGSSGRLLGLSNPHVKAMARIIVESGLGTEDEALMCIVPIFVQAGILPREDAVAAKLPVWARRLRRKGMFPRAEFTLTVLLGNSDAAIRSTAARELGEVYRKAYASGEAHQEWGRLGLRRLARLEEAVRDRTSRAAKELESLTLNGWPARYPPTKEEIGLLSQYGELFVSDTASQRTLDVHDLMQYLKAVCNEPRSARQWASVLGGAMRVDFSATPDNDLKNLVRITIGHPLLPTEEEEDDSHFLDFRLNLVEDLLEARPGLVKYMQASGWLLSEVMAPAADSRIVTMLLELGEIPLSSPYNDAGDMLLSLAIKEGRSDIVRLLLDRGAPVNKPVERAYAVVVHQDPSAVEGTNEELGFLLSSVPSTEGAALHTAIYADQPEMVSWLLQGGANANMRIKGDLRYAINIACTLGRLEVLKRLRDSGIITNVNVVSPLGSPLAIACALGRTEMVEVLLAMGADVNVRGGGDRLGPPLVVACLQYHEAVVPMLLGVDDVDANIVGFGGLTALCAAVRSGRVDGIRRLLAAGADVDLAGPDGTTALLTAVVHKVWDDGFRAVAVLLAAGADPNRRGGKALAHLSPLEICGLDELEVPAELSALLQDHGGARANPEPSSQVESWRRRTPRLELGRLGPPPPPPPTKAAAGAEIHTQGRETPEQ